MVKMLSTWYGCRFVDMLTSMIDVVNLDFLNSIHILSPKIQQYCGSIIKMMTNSHLDPIR